MFDPYLLAAIDEQFGEGFAARLIFRTALISVLGTLALCVLGANGLL